MATDILQLLVNRASCRSFRDEPIPDDVLEQVLAAGTRAATGGNLQPYSIIVVRDATVRAQLAELAGRQMFIARAPVSLLFCIDWHRLRRWASLSDAPFTATQSFRHFWISFQDTVICAQTICTAADAVGLGSVYIGTILECFRELKDMFALPNGVFPVVLVCLGYPATPSVSKPKLGVDAVVHWERYRQLQDDELLRAFSEKYGDMQLEPTPERLEIISHVCTSVHGPQFAERCLKRIRSDGYISAAQRYFALHYRADRMAAGNEHYLELMREFGFGWFEPFRPPVSAP